MDNLNTVQWQYSLTYKYGTTEPSYIDNLLRDSAYITTWKELQDKQERELYIKFVFADAIVATPQVYDSVAREISESRLQATIVSQTDDGVIVQLRSEGDIFDAYEYSKNNK